MCWDSLEYYKITYTVYHHFIVLFYNVFDEADKN